MSPTTHAVAAYAVTILLLWGYAMTLWLSARRRRRINNQDNPGRTSGNNPGVIRGHPGASGGIRGGSDPS